MCGELLIVQKKIVVYGLDVSVDPKKCAWVWIDYEGKKQIGEPGVNNLITSLNQHLDYTIYFGIEAPMWIPVLKETDTKMSFRFVEEKNREWYHDSGAGASVKSMVLWDFIRMGLSKEIEKIDLRPFEGFATGCYKPTKELYSTIMSTFKDSEKRLTEDTIDAYIIAHARWTDLLQCDEKIIDSYYEKLIKDKSNLLGSFKSLWDGLEGDKIKYPTIYGYKFQWHLREAVVGKDISFSGDDLRIHRKTKEIKIKMKLEKKYRSLKFSISSSDFLYIEDIILLS
ncbi:hypothetical protein SAMN05518848_10766 [Paenibacillus sp. PDC88]|nr:hypothetical protein SAMN05518848_10766 [Paenibacillus sp. PDC88]